MKKLFILLAAVLLTLFSCTKEFNYEDLRYDAYQTSFVQQYPTVDLNSTDWDFSECTDTATAFDLIAKTRGIYEGSTVLNKWDVGNGDPKTDIYNLGNVRTLNELGWIRNNLPTIPTKDWDPYATNDLWVYYIHGNGNTEYFPTLGVHWIDKSKNPNVEYITQMPICGYALGSGWYYGSGAQGTGVRISGEAYKEGVSEFYWFATDDLNSFGIDKKLTTFKEVNTPYGAVYYCFDCDGNSDFSDIVCLSIPTVAAKRYMIEDLGSIGDFDFNDIVVDVYDNGTKQVAKIRAMGGTMDFTLKIGNTTWTKSENGFDPNVMYNTQNPDYDAVLAEFEVTGWKDNNISVLVNDKNSGKVLTIKFPKAGEAPMIVAFNPGQQWMRERKQIPSDWFTE